MNGFCDETNIHDTLRLIKACTARGLCLGKVCGGRRARCRRLERRAHRDRAAGRSATSIFGKSMSVSATLLV